MVDPESYAEDANDLICPFSGSGAVGSMDGGALDVVVCGGGPGWGNGCMSAGGNRLKAAGGTLGGGGIGRTGGDVAIGVPFPQTQRRRQHGRRRGTVGRVLGPPTLGRHRHLLADRTFFLLLR